LTRDYKPREYALGERLLELRNRVGLTQTALGQLIGVSKRSILKWEGGEGAPSESYLGPLLAVFATRGAFSRGQELAEAEALWEQVRASGVRRLGRFDGLWFEQLLAVDGGTQSSAAEHPADPHITAAPPLAGDGRGVVRGLPFQPTSFVGREAESARIISLLHDPACRLLTLLGPGGIGKTRFALAVAAGQADAFADGVAVVELAQLANPDQMVTAIGHSLGLSFDGQPDAVVHLLAALRDRHMLLVLDNFEHLLASADLVYDILKDAPGVTVLATSRERLNLQAEWLFDVDGLAYPRESAPDSLAPTPSLRLTDYSAVQLFIQRLSQAQLQFPLSEATLRTIGRICEQVAGMPLAIELAAANTRVLALGEIEQQLRANLDVLTTTLRDVPARHRSMHAVFDHSWQLLDAQERTLFSHLAVFRGSWTLAAAEHVAGATLSSLTQLVDKSLLRPLTLEVGAYGALGERNDVAEPRYTMLEPLREYALGQLAAQGEVAALQRAHASYYLALTERAAQEWDNWTSRTMLVQLDREHDNLRAVLQWACDGGDSLVGLQLSGMLWKFWRGRGYVIEGRRWLAALLALDDTRSDSTVTAARMQATYGAAWLASGQHDYAQAAQLFEQSMALRQALGQTERETSLLVNAARQARVAGHYHRATELLEDALSQHRAQGDRRNLNSGGLGLSLYELALVIREQGHFERSAALYAESVQLHRELGDIEGVAQAMLGQSDIARDKGDIAGIRQYSTPIRVIFAQLGTQWAIGYVLNNQAVGAYLEGDLKGAAVLAGESVELFRGIHNDSSLAEVLITLGQIRRAQGDASAAYNALSEALRLAQAVGPRLLLTTALEAMASVLVLQESPAWTARMLAAAATMREQMGVPMRPLDQIGVEQTRDAARAALGPSAFAALWSEAEGLTPDQLIATILDASSLEAWSSA
jgi:predicted ATPase/transcriptional regulator with XRE-family HTH domain